MESNKGRIVQVREVRENGSSQDIKRHMKA